MNAAACATGNDSGSWARQCGFADSDNYNVMLLYDAVLWLL
jgi:hypothetical protein